MSDHEIKRTLRRRQFLALTGSGAALAAIPGVLGLGAAGAATATSPSSRDILSGPEYPIGFWWPPPPEETTVSRYAEIAEAGFTFVTGGNGVNNMPLNATMLDAAAANGLQALPTDDRIGTLTSQPPEQWHDIASAALADYEPHPAFSGFSIVDEPNASRFAGLGDEVSLLRELHPQIFPYINLLPTYATVDQLGTPTYQEYLQQFVDAVDPSVLSFDHYALLGETGIRADYFYNWALVRQAALAADVPSWVFILAMDHLGYRRPTAAELLWQVNVSLSYGCKCIQYFTYWRPAGDGWGQALIDIDGNRTPQYDNAKTINTQYLRPVGKQLLPLLSESVAHANETPLPQGAAAFAPDDYLAAVDGSAVIVSRFRDPADAERRWILVANRAYDATADVTVTFTPAVQAVSEFDPAQNAYRPVPLDTHAMSLTLDAGAARLYSLT